MDILNFISWIKGGRVVTSVDPTQTLLPVGLKDNRRDDGYLTGAITVEDFAAQLAPVPAYKVYTALLSQVGTSDPTAIVLENTLSNPVIITRNSAGNYSITCSDFADTTKVYVELKAINVLSSSSPSQYYWFTVNPGDIVINSTYINLITNSITPTDFVLNNTPIEIRVYS
jgi:hypothetical protein